MNALWFLLLKTPDRCNMVNVTSKWCSLVNYTPTLSFYGLQMSKRRHHPKPICSFMKQTIACFSEVGAAEYRGCIGTQVMHVEAWNDTA